MNSVYATLLATSFTSCLTITSVGLSAQTVTSGKYRAELKTDPASIVTGNTTILDFLISDLISMTPGKGLRVTASLTMPAMAEMVLKQPRVVSNENQGHYYVQVVFPNAGDYILDIHVKTGAVKSESLTFKITPGKASKVDMQGMPGMSEMNGNTKATNMQSMSKMAGMQGMPESHLKAVFGGWPVNREGSGTSWQPDSSPMFMRDIGRFGGFDFSLMGTFQGGYVDAGGKRGDNGQFTNSMLMLNGRRELGDGIIGLHFMSSFDPILNGRHGVPNLFQNGFTVNGTDIADRKDPHNLFAELAASYSRPLTKGLTGFIYGGPVGEPALGNVMYFHRTSGSEIPEAPISHDWFDGSHISSGVATLGLTSSNKWKLEGSLFNGHEPSSLYGLAKLGLNSASTRLTYNPAPDWALSASYGYLNADSNEHRLTVSAAYSHSFTNGDNLSITSYVGRNIVTGSVNSNAWLAEGTLYHKKEALFARFERVDKDQLVNVPMGVYTINKLIFGDVHNFLTKDHMDYGLGAYAGVYSFPKSLNGIYGKNPVTYGIFLRIHPSKM